MTKPAASEKMHYKLFYEMKPKETSLEVDQTPKDTHYLKIGQSPRTTYINTSHPTLVFILVCLAYLAFSLWGYLLMTTTDYILKWDSGFSLLCRLWKNPKTSTPGEFAMNCIRLLPPSNPLFSIYSRKMQHLGYPVPSHIKNPSKRG